MPQYEFFCHACSKPFSKTLSLKEYEEGGVACPDCGRGRTEAVVVLLGHIQEERLSCAETILPRERRVSVQHSPAAPRNAAGQMVTISMIGCVLRRKLPSRRPAPSPRDPMQRLASTSGSPAAPPLTIEGAGSTLRVISGTDAPEEHAFVPGDRRKESRIITRTLWKRFNSDRALLIEAQRHRGRARIAQPEVFHHIGTANSGVVGQAESRVGFESKKPSLPEVEERSEARGASAFRQHTGPPRVLLRILFLHYLRCDDASHNSM